MEEMSLDAQAKFRYCQRKGKNHDRNHILVQSARQPCMLLDYILKESFVKLALSSCTLHTYLNPKTPYHFPTPSESVQQLDLGLSTYIIVILTENIPQHLKGCFRAYSLSPLGVGFPPCTRSEGRISVGRLGCPQFLWSIEC
jgi:hypothetical protein